jgi:serine/threonine-protein kinase HipA
MYQTTLAGILTETGDGEYHFQYTAAYVAAHPDRFLTFLMPVRHEPYVSKQLFPFFVGLIPEGWLLDIAATSWRVDREDNMGLLLVCCRNCIGAVSIIPMEEAADE